MKPATEELIDALASTINNRRDAKLKIELSQCGIEIELSAGVRGFVFAAELNDGEQTPGESIRSMLSRLLAEVSVADLDSTADPVEDDGDFINWMPGELLGLPY
jgi:hypothetical protein